MAEVTSSNTVGYTKIQVGAGLSIVGMPFADIGGGSLDVQTVVPDTTAVSGGLQYMRLWNGEGYNTYYYYSVAAEGIDDDCNAGWGNVDQEEVNVDIPAGTAFWVSSGKVETITVAGEVTETVQVPVFAGLTLVCNPQSVATDIQDIVPSNTQTSGGLQYMRLWNGEGYNTYYYYSVAAEGIDDDCNAGWGNVDQEAVSVTIPAGQGFWISSGRAETLTFPNALSAE